MPIPRPAGIRREHGRDVVFGTSPARPAPARREKGKAAESGPRAIPAALVAWLSRPLASFHLIMALCGMLVLLGVIMVLSASSVSSGDPATGGGVYAQFLKQLMFVGFGGVTFWIGLRLPLRRLRRAASSAMVAGLAGLVLVLTPLGASADGAQRWFVLGPFSLQPVEIAKVALTLWGAHILVTKAAVLHQWRHLLVPLVPAALLTVALVMAQPNLSGTITLAVVVLALLWFAGAPKRLFAILLAGGLAGILVLALVAQYRLARVLSFLSPDQDYSGAAYQARQAQYALADGGLFGLGLGQGQSKWNYLPNVQNDFIFALIGEELGFVGCAVVLALFAAVAVVGLRIALRNRDPWIRIVTGTLTVLLTTQAAINIGYVVGLLPVTGVTLPLVSYGGTSLVVTTLLFGILANAARHEPEAAAALRTLGPGRLGGLLRLPAPELPRRAPSRPRRRPART
ncbi:putative lipid II flippase FtsW [Amycolatopsis sp. NBC_01480]|uniref:putative lipid II flippase FtsW n=1 Tax=Amycolatopsis sp. NBC_01480 TaxID=2903562 RepID=UPI003FA47D48